MNKPRQMPVRRIAIIASLGISMQLSIVLPVLSQTFDESAYDALKRAAGDSYARRRFLHHLGTAAMEAISHVHHQAAINAPDSATQPATIDKAYGSTYRYDVRCPCTARTFCGDYLPITNGMTHTSGGSASLIRELHCLETAISASEVNQYQTRNFSVQSCTFGAYHVDTPKGSCVMAPKGNDWVLLPPDAVPAR